MELLSKSNPTSIEWLMSDIIYYGSNDLPIKQYILDNHKGEMEFVFINNDIYSTTNNIYSFYLAKEELEKDDTILLESDVIFEKDLIKKVVEYQEKDVAVVAKYESWMDGTCVTVDEDHNILSFIEKENMKKEKMDRYYKTVNVYRFSKVFVSAGSDFTFLFSIILDKKSFFNPIFLLAPVFIIFALSFGLLSSSRFSNIEGIFNFFGLGISFDIK